MRVRGRLLLSSVVKFRESIPASRSSRPGRRFFSLLIGGAQKKKVPAASRGSRRKEGERCKRGKSQSQHTMQSFSLHNIAAVSESSSSFVDCFDFAAALNKTGAAGRNSFSGKANDGQFNGRKCGQRGRRS